MAKRLEIDFSQNQYSSYEDMIAQLLMRIFQRESNKDIGISTSDISDDFVGALLGNIGKESNFNPFAYNPDDAGTGSSSSGLFQHHKERETALLKFMTENGFTSQRLENLFLGLEQPTEDEVIDAISLQLEFALIHDGKDSEILQGIVGSTSTEELTDGFSKFERYAGYNDPNSDAYKARRDSIANYQFQNRQLVVDARSRTHGTGKTRDRKIDEAVKDKPLSFEYKFFNNESEVNDGFENGLLTDQQSQSILRSTFGHALRQLCKRKGLQKDISLYTEKELNDFIKTSVNRKEVRDYIAASLNYET